MAKFMEGGVLETLQAIALRENGRPRELHDIRGVENAAEAAVHGAANGFRATRYDVVRIAVRILLLAAAGLKG